MALHSRSLIPSILTAVASGLLSPPVDAQTLCDCFSWGWAFQRAVVSTGATSQLHEQRVGECRRTHETTLAFGGGVTMADRHPDQAGATGCPTATDCRGYGWTNGHGYASGTFTSAQSREPKSLTYNSESLFATCVAVGHRAVFLQGKNQGRRRQEHASGSGPVDRATGIG